MFGVKRVAASPIAVGRAVIADGTECSTLKLSWKGSTERGVIVPVVDKLQSPSNVLSRTSSDRVECNGESYLDSS